jgi:hypothetical protein
MTLKHKLAIALLALAAVAAGFTAYSLAVSRADNSKASRSFGDAPTDEQLSAGDDIADRTKTQSDGGSDPNAVGSDRPPAPTPAPDGGKSIVKVTIASVNQNDGVLQIRTLISAVASTGSCTLTLVNEGVTITRTAQIQALPSSATCKGFDIALSELSVGPWQATLVYENDELTGTATKEIKVY